MWRIGIPDDSPSGGREERARPPFGRVLRVMLRTHWSAEAWWQIQVEFKKALALRSEIRRADWLASKATGSE